MKDLRWKIQTWTHKAVRLAYKRFAIPRDRKIAAFEEIENLNDSLLAKSDKSSGKLLSLENENALNQLGIKLENLMVSQLPLILMEKKNIYKILDLLKMVVIGV